MSVDLGPATAGPSFTFSSPDGHELVKKFIQQKFKYEPHNYQLEGVCRSLDGSDLFAILPTGAGKTAYFSMYMLVLRALSELPNARARFRLPEEPAMVVVYPTLGLEEEMAKTFTALGLPTLVINHRTVHEASERGKNLWLKARSGFAMVLMSPEMLASDGFETVLLHRNSAFLARVCALGVDEAHLSYVWGRWFRKSYETIGLTKHRLPPSTTLILTTATMRTGEPMRHVLQSFGLELGRFHLIQHSNIRPEIRFIFRTLSRGVNGPNFPDLRFVLSQTRKTIIFVKSIKQANLLRDYLHDILLSTDPTTPPDQVVRTYNSVNYADYNETTLRLFREDSCMHVIIATNSLMVGVDLPNVQDVLLLTIPEDSDELLQKAGRGARDLRIVSEARAIVFLGKTASKTAKAILDGSHQKKKTAGGKAIQGEFDESMARLINAECITRELNVIYNNPLEVAPCPCPQHTAFPRTLSSCKCSGPNCMPEQLPPCTTKADKVPHPVKRSLRLTCEMKAFATARLIALRAEFYNDADDREAAVIPEEIYLPDDVISAVLDRYALINAIEDLDPFLSTATYVRPNQAHLWDALVALKPAFERMRAEAKQKAKQKAATRRAEKAQARLKQSQAMISSEAVDDEERSETESEDSGDDSEEQDDVNEAAASSAKEGLEALRTPHRKHAASKRKRGETVTGSMRQQKPKVDVSPQDGSGEDL